MRRFALNLGLMLTALLLISNSLESAPARGPNIANSAAAEQDNSNDAAAEIGRRAAELELRKAILDARAEVEAASHSRLEVIGGWLAVIVGLFGILITGVIIFFALNTRAAAAAEARKEIADEKEKIAKTVAEASRNVTEAARIVAEAAANLEQAKAKVEEIESHRVRAATIAKEVEETAATVLAGGKPTAEAVQELELASDAIESRPLHEWSEGAFTIRIGAAAARGDAQQVIDLSVAMRQHFSEPRAQAYAMRAEGWALSELGRSEEAIAILDDLIDRFGDSHDPELRKQIASALVSKGFALGNLGRLEDTIAINDYIFARFGDSDDPSLNDEVAMAYYNRACAFARTGKAEAAIVDLRQWSERKAGFNCSKVQTDRDFDSIRSDPTFVAFMEEMGCPPTPHGA